MPRNFDRRLNAAWWALRIGLGAGPIIVGLDKLQQNRELGDVAAFALSQLSAVREDTIAIRETGSTLRASA